MKFLWLRNKKNDKIIFGSIWQNATGQGDHFSTGYLLDYIYFKENYMLIGIDLSKQGKLDVDSKAMQQINFIGNLQARWKYTNVFHYWRSERNTFRFFRRNS